MTEGAALFALPAPDPGDDAIERAVTAAFDDLNAAQLLGPIERAKKAALVKAAAALDRGLATSKVSVATSTVLKQVIEGLDSLPSPLAGNDAEIDALDATLQALTLNALNDGGDDDDH